jgi:hypothetical protein
MKAFGIMRWLAINCPVFLFHPRGNWSFSLERELVTADMKGANLGLWKHSQR